MSAFDLIAENNFGDTRSGSLAGPLGLLVILLLAIGTVLLIRNMNARLKRLPESFPDPAQTDQAMDGPARTDPVAGQPDGGSGPDASAGPRP